MQPAALIKCPWQIDSHDVDDDGRVWTEHLAESLLTLYIKHQECLTGRQFCDATPGGDSTINPRGQYN